MLSATRAQGWPPGPDRTVRRKLLNLLEEEPPLDHLDDTGNYHLTPHGTLAAIAAEAAARAAPPTDHMGPSRVEVDAKTVEIPREMEAGLQPQMARSWLRWFQQMYRLQRQHLCNQRLAFVDKTTFEMLSDHVRKRYSITINDETLVDGLSRELCRLNDESPVVQTFQQDWVVYRRIIHVNTVMFRQGVESLHPGSYDRFMRHEATFGNLFDTSQNTWWDRAGAPTVRLDLESLDLHHLDNPISDDLQLDRKHAELERQSKDVYWVHGVFQHDLVAAVFSTVHANWKVTPPLVRQSWKHLLSMRLSSLRRATQHASAQIETDMELYLTQPDLNNRATKTHLLRDLRSWKNAITMSQETPDDIKDKLEAEINASEAALMDRRRELAHIQSPENLVKVRLLSDTICMLEWTRLAEFNIRRLTQLFETMPRVFFEFSGFDNQEDNEMSKDLTALRTRWTTNLEQLMEQQHELKQTARDLSDEASAIRSHVYSAAQRIDIDLTKYEIHEQLHSVFTRRDEDGHRPTGQDAYTLLMDEVNALITAAEKGRLQVPMKVTKHLAKEEARLVRQGVNNRNEPRKALVGMFDRLRDAVDTLETFSMRTDMRVRRTKKRARTMRNDIDLHQPPPRIQFDAPNNCTVLLPPVRQDLSDLINKTYARLDTCDLTYESNQRPSISDTSTVSDAWIIVSNLIRVESWIFFSS